MVFAGIKAIFVICAIILSNHVAMADSLPPRNVKVVDSSHTSGGHEYIVILSKKAGTRRDAHAAAVLSQLDLSPSHPDVRLLFNNSAFHGFAASMKSHCVNLLHSMDDVAHVEKSVAISAHRSIPVSQQQKRDAPSTRKQATWGLQRISSSASVVGDPSALTYTYSTAASPQGLGAGVDIYVVDSGIYVQHAVFNGRARMGWSFQANATDGDGHGTHVSGTAAGETVGVASAANVIGVKVLGSNGSGSTADTIAGMDYVVSQHDRRKAEGAGSGFVGSVMSMSWGLTSTSSAISSAIAAAADAGIHVSVAAGNDGADACNYSPANSGGSANPAVVTVGSVNIENSISSFSNTGACVDLYAPGEDVVSSWIDSPTTINWLSGTSMACPHVSGVMAYLVAQDPIGLGQNPVALKAKLLGMALRGAISSDGNALLLNNGVSSATAQGKPTRREVEWDGRGDEVSSRVRGLATFFSRKVSHLD